MATPVLRPDPPYRQIAAQIRARIANGELQAGEPVPSTRRIAAEWDVAMATATKALAELKRAGLVRVVPGTATVVSATADAGGHPRPRSGGAGRRPDQDPTTTAARIVSAAIAVADREGIGAVTMRRVAAELGVGAMSLYRHVPGKAELVRQMADTAFARCQLPHPGPDGWRDRLEIVAKLHWDVYRRHPWVAGYVLASPHRPQLVPHAMDHVEWELQALTPLGVDDLTMLQAVISVHCFVGGLAMSQAPGPDLDDQPTAPAEQISPDRFPTLTGLRLTAATLADLNGLFEFGLRSQLDGLATSLGPPPTRTALDP